jgi:hypothetical protein
MAVCGWSGFWRELIKIAIFMSLKKTTFAFAVVSATSKFVDLNSASV